MHKEGSPALDETRRRDLSRAIAISIAGFAAGVRHEAAIRHNLIALFVLLPAAIALPVSPLEHLLLILSMMLVVLVEFVNSAIEKAVDRISMEQHPLSKAAKDYGSAAVMVAVLMSGLCWTAIAGPLLWKWAVT